MNNGPLRELAPRLIDRLELLEKTQSEEDIVNDFFVMQAKDEELIRGIVEPEYYPTLADLARRQVLPLYRAYRKERDEIESRASRRKWQYYVGGAVLAAEILEAIATRGASLRPMVIALTVPIEALAGALVYQAVSQTDKYKVHGMRQKLLKSIESIDDKLVIDRQYRDWQEMTTNEFLPSEAASVLARYESPTKFWQDYWNVRKADPSNENEFRSLGVPSFREFLDAHIKGIYPEQVREYRFNKLFGIAQKAFLEQDSSSYALKQAELIANQGDKSRKMHEGGIKQ